MTHKLPFLFAFALVTVAALTGCSGSDGDIEVDAAKTPLTASPNDALFTIKVTDARDDGYPLDKLVVKATPDGKDAITVSCTASDTNKNNKLDKGETLSCSEGATNVLGPDMGGTEIAIELRATVDGDDTLVGKSTWTPVK